MDRAREQAKLAAAQLRETTERALEPASPINGEDPGGDGSAPGVDATAPLAVGPPAAPPATPDAARQLASRALAEARSGLSKLVDHLDPGMLADVVIRTTTIQERANASLRTKGSPYRIDGIQITATVPPQISFSIGRIEPDGSGEPIADLTEPSTPN